MTKPFSWGFEKGTWVSRELVCKKPIKVEAWICCGEMRHHSILWVNWVCFWCVACDISAGFLLCQQSHTQQSLHFDSVCVFRLVKSCVYVCMIKIQELWVLRVYVKRGTTHNRRHDKFGTTKFVIKWLYWLGENWDGDQ